jgi:prepilin-type N-terminal cleavage/methylation domain-containing protein
MVAPALRRLRALPRRVQNEERGYSLVELIITMAILGVIMTAVASLFISGIYSQTDLDQRFQAQVQLNTAVVKLRREAHNACGLRAGNTTSVITLNMPGIGNFQPPATPCTVPLTVTWCTYGSGTRWALYRIDNSTTCPTSPAALPAAAKKYADFITIAGIFTSYTAKDPVNSILGRMHIHIPVNVEKNAAATSVYTLDDDIIMRNSG